MITKLYPDNPDYTVVEEIVRALEEGELIIYPTGIGYALGCNALKQQAVEETYRLKQSNIRKQRFAIMCSSLADASKYAKIDNTTFKYIKEHSGEPITYILPPLSTLPKLLKNAKEIGIRISQHPATTLLLENLKVPLLTTSLPLQKEEIEYVTHPELIHEEYGHLVYTVLDGGIAEGLKSAIVRIEGSNIEVLREIEPIKAE